MEPMVGVEPTTYGLRNRCSTTELHWLFISKQTKQRLFCLGPNESQVNSPRATVSTVSTVSPVSRAWVQLSERLDTRPQKKELTGA